MTNASAFTADSFIGHIRAITEKRNAEAQAKSDEFARLLAPLRAMQLENYVADVRDEIDAAAIEEEAANKYVIALCVTCICKLSSFIAPLSPQGSTARRGETHAHSRKDGTGTIFEGTRWR